MNEIKAPGLLGVLQGRSRLAVPEELGVEVGVRVDEARRHDAVRGVDLLARLALDRAHGDDPPVLDGHVGALSRGAFAVHHDAVADDHVVHV